MPMSATWAATEPPSVHDTMDHATTLHGMAAVSRREVFNTFDSFRAAAGDAGERMPELVRSARTGATDGLRAIKALPEPAQRMLGVFSLGVGVGLMVAGAPRLLVGGAVLPALAVLAPVLGRVPEGTRKPA